jgi:hypothetical protein
MGFIYTADIAYDGDYSSDRNGSFCEGGHYVGQDDFGVRRSIYLLENCS